MRLLQASDDKSGVVVAITKSNISIISSITYIVILTAMKDAAKLMKPISDAIDSGKFDKRKELQFVYGVVARLLGLV